MDMREALLIEDEKERIRRGIIAEEVDRVRILNAERMREPMMPRVGRLPPSGAFFMGFEPRFPPPEQQPQHRPVQERMAIPFGERLGMGISSAGMPARQEFGYFERRVELSISEVHFEQRSVEPMISEIPSKNHVVQSQILELKPPSNPKQLSKELKISGVGAATEHDKEKGKLLAKPNVNLSGVKRRAEMAAEAVPTTRVPKKKIKDGWYCALCQVSVQSECDLNSHLKGRKHKSMEVGLRAQGNGKTKELAMKKFKFWCDLCNVGAFTENSMKDHERGKKHTSMLQEIKANGTSGIVTKVNDNEEAGKGAEKD